MATAKSPLVAASPYANSNLPGQHPPAIVSRSPNYQDPARSYLLQEGAHIPTQPQGALFPRHSGQALGQPEGFGGGPDDETLSRTLVSSQFPPPETDVASLLAPVAIRPAKLTEEWDATQRGSSIIDGSGSGLAMQRSNSFSGSTAGGITGDGSVNLSRGNTLKKKASMRRSVSLKRSSSRRSMKAGSVRSLALQQTTDEAELHSAFYCPVPTSGNPTEALANRFLAWRKILKDLITYFREIQFHYEHRSKSLLKLANVLNNTSTPPGFLASGGLDDALQILRNYNKQVIAEANKAKEIEEDVILALTGLRSDLHQKIKEIRNLSGDFKNTVEKEMEATRRTVNYLQDVLGQTDLDPALTTGKQDPYLLRLAADRQLERQLEEENYLHQAYLNLENSGRELEAIVVGEIQKSYNAYSGILKREADAAYSAVDELRIGPIAMPKDIEWNAFIQRDDQFVDPEVPIRSAEFITYPGKEHYACQEVRAGLLERKSKYLKSYTAGWYVLSPTHLHEFKSADKTQAPVMSLYLPEQKLGSHSSESGSSNKFVLKGRQTGAMHRGHTWVFRAESHDTMMAWYEDIKALTEKSPEERSNFVRVHSRSYSRSSQRSVSSDGVVDEDDDEPFSAADAVTQQTRHDALPRRPSPGGRFPSDLQVNAERGLQVPLSPLSMSSGIAEEADHEQDDAASDVGPGNALGTQFAGKHDPRIGYGSTARTPMEQAPSHAAMVRQQAQEDGINPYKGIPTLPHASTFPATFSVVSATSNSHAGSLIATSPAGWPEQDLAADSEIARNGHTARGAEHSVPPLDITVLGRREPSAGLYASPNRPSIASARTDSVPTISHLHVPGEYPRGTSVS